MTTIAWDGKTLAADRLVVGSRACGRSKIVSIVDGAVAASGLVSDGIRFLEWLKRGAEQKKSPKSFGIDFCALVVRDGRVYSYHKDCVAFEQDAPFAIGSGAHYALGAMEAGASAVDAVRIAIRLLGDASYGVDAWGPEEEARTVQK